MLSIVRVFSSLARLGLFELGILRWLRVRVTLREAASESLRVKAASQRLGVQRLNPEYLRESLRKPDADTLFVLGSGSSVNDLSPSNFATVSEQVSVGVNAWVLHDFVPDFYAYEPVSDRSLDQFHTLSLMSRVDISARKPHIVFLKPRNSVEEEQLSMVPAELLSQTHLYGRFQPFTRVVSNLGGDLGKVFHSLSSTSSVVPDSGASVVRLTGLAFLMRFRKIVLVGVDLYGSNYFWEDNPDHLRRAGVTSWDGGQKPGLHETMIPNNRAFVALDMFAALQSVLERHGVELLVASRKSLLATFLDVYNFPKRAETV